MPKTATEDNANRKIKDGNFNLTFGIHFPVICDKLFGSKRMVTNNLRDILLNNLYKNFENTIYAIK